MKSTTANISYATYCQVIASLDPNRVVAFDFKIPTFLKGLWSDLKSIGELLKESAGIGWDAIVAAFKEKSIFALLKGVGFSLGKLLKAVHQASSILSNAIFNALKDLKEVFGSLEAIKKLKVKERLAKLDALTKKHPVLAKLTGVAVAGFLVWMFIHAAFTGHAVRDLELVHAIIDCLKGSYDLVDLFTSDNGLYALSVLLLGLSGVGIPALTGSAVSSISQGLAFLGSNADAVSGLLLALFYAAAKTLKLKINFSKAPKALSAKRIIADASTGVGGGVVFVAEDTGRMLFLLRSPNCDEPNTWACPGGGIEDGESVTEGIRRELQEEINFTRKVNLEPMHIDKQDNGFTYHNYYAFVPTEFTPELNDEHTDFRWSKEFPDPMHPGLRRSFDAFIKQAPNSNFLTASVVTGAMHQLEILKLLSSYGFSDLLLKSHEGAMYTYNYIEGDVKRLKKMFGDPTLAGGGKVMVFSIPNVGKVAVSESNSMLRFKDETTTESRKTDTSHLGNVKVPPAFETAFMKAQSSPPLMPKFCTKLYEHFNKEKFGGKLDPCPIKVSPKPPSGSKVGKHTRGYYQRGLNFTNHHMWIGSFLFNARIEFFLEIFLHEMCHAAAYNISQSTDNSEQGHGPVWQGWMVKVGLDPRRFDITDDAEYKVGSEKLKKEEENTKMFGPPSTPAEISKVKARGEIPATRASSGEYVMIRSGRVIKGFWEKGTKTFKYKVGRSPYQIKYKGLNGIVLYPAD